jgi:hypothetical protein
MELEKILPSDIIAIRASEYNALLTRCDDVF